MMADEHFPVQLDEVRGCESIRRLTDDEIEQARAWEARVREIVRDEIAVDQMAAAAAQVERLKAIKPGRLLYPGGPGF